MEVYVSHGRSFDLSVVSSCCQWIAALSKNDNISFVQDFALGSKNLPLSHNTRWHAEVFGQPSLHLAKGFVVAADRIRGLATMLRFLAVFVAMSPLIALKEANFAPFGKVQKVVCTCLRLCFLG